MRGRFAEKLSERVLVFDGAMGTVLHVAGNSLDRALPELNLSNPELVSTIHEGYVAAGADVLLTNTFGANRLRLAEHGCSVSVRDINLAAVRLARQARRGVHRTIYVAGSVSPAVSAGQRSGVRADERLDVVREQVTALVDGGVDLLVLETFGHLEELTEAVEAAADLTDLPIVAHATFTADGLTPGGETPSEVAKALSGLPVTAIGANCTLGPQHMLTVLDQLTDATDLPVGVHPNAGMPRRTGRRFTYPVARAHFGRYARRYAEHGAAMIGGCCGTTPGHIREVVARLADLRPRETRPVTAVPQPRPAPPQSPLARRLAQPGFVLAAQVTPRGEPEDAQLVRDSGLDLVLVRGHFGDALHLERETGVDTITTVEAWDRSLAALQADLLGAHAFGLRTVVCETGTPLPLGDYPGADGIWEVDSVGLIGLLAGLNAGRDHTGLTLATRTAFHIGARINPGAEDADVELSRTKAKIAAGAQFLITRPVYDLAGLSRMVTELSGVDIPVLVAIEPLSGYAEAEYLAYEVPDVTIPPSTLSALESAGDREAEVGLALAAEVLDGARSLVRGAVVVAGKRTGKIEPLVRQEKSSA
ncbi:bifunctional homocysteine S-methyltransferase/methylenetetrahydrofolate reductase [Amycolatopsis thermophila]|uniref:Homocysteine S-methyltransferase n=1 Tax=Amycolatopsis thermophila TaxID=206084 RepID=A0ABU0F5X6_9PSEU|nr:bifunctional homocysteine S-methyltransferase/methylenetetrahydrofolate reductase [Amycolatopsis thermophila]MDQ0382432.1 homocysteine S-methyltransferase [Amycolatopsis thermophila]